MTTTVAKGSRRTTDQVWSALAQASFAVLSYYAIANASAYTLDPEQRRWPRGLSVAGLIGCIGLALLLPAGSVVTGLGVLAAGAIVWFVRHRA